MQRYRNPALAILVLWVLAVCGPELFEDRIYPFDSALFAANGAMFEALFRDLQSFATAPVEWLYTYYDQYPALLVRRHPPLFSLLEGLVFLVTGTSVFSAKLTLLLFSLSFVLAVYCTSLELWRKESWSVAIAALLVTSPAVLGGIRSVWLHVPALSLCLWAFYFYARHLRSEKTRRQDVLGFLAFAVLALYTYQLPALLLLGVAAHLVIRTKGRVFLDRNWVIGFATAVVLSIPLILQAAIWGRDALMVAGGVAHQDWIFNVPIASKLEFAYWTHYIEGLITRYPVQSVGLAVWLLTAPTRRITSGEWLFLICFVVSLLGFTWIPARNPHYLMYMAVSLTPLTVIGVSSVLSRMVPSASLGRSTLGLVLLLASCALQFLFVPNIATYLAGMGAGPAAIFTESSAPRILYSGPHDAAFVFYLRKLDAGRQARVWRASVQVETPGDIPALLADEAIEFIALETSRPEFEKNVDPIYDRFQVMLEDLLSSSDEFEQMDLFRLPYGKPGKEAPLELTIYRRAI